MHTTYTIGAEDTWTPVRPSASSSFSSTCAAAARCNLTAPDV